jgi:hypothetical protein
MSYWVNVNNIFLLQSISSQFKLLTNSCFYGIRTLVLWMFCSNFELTFGLHVFEVNDMAKKKRVIKGPWLEHNQYTFSNVPCTEEADNVIRGRWAGGSNSRLSSHTLQIRVQRLLTNLLAALDELPYAHKFFGSEKEVWPDQCERVIGLIGDIGEPIRGLCQLLETGSQLPEAAIPLRYPIVVILHDADKQVGDLLRLISQLNMKQSLTGQRVKQPQEIQYKLESITKACKDILHRGYTLLEEVRYQQRWIANL